MIQAAIVDDDPQSISQLVKLIDQYAKEKGIDIQVSQWQDSAQFVFNYKPIYDIIFLDVEMPKINGMEVAKSIRDIDEAVFLVFETEFGKYSIQGYRYGAMDYFLKPVSYYDLKIRMNALVKRIAERIPVISINIGSGAYKVLKTSEILYIEEVGRKQVFHTADGEFSNFTREGLSFLEKKLSPYGFCRCNSGFLINLTKVTGFSTNQIQIGKTTFEISRLMKQKVKGTLSRTLNKEVGKI
jgi:two-component system response regulator LytT